MKKTNLSKIFFLVAVCVIIGSVTVSAALIGTSSATLSDTQTSSTGNLVALWGTSGTGKLRVISYNGESVTAKAMRVRVGWFDQTLETVETNSNIWTAWTPPFPLSTVDVGYYVRVEGDTSAKGKGEFEVYQ